MYTESQKNPRRRNRATDFPSTSWSLIDHVKADRGGLAPEAVNELMAKYWRPIFYFIRSKGYARPLAEDLTQEFFLRFLEKEWILRADPHRGRFRTYMITILVRFLSDQSEKRVSRQVRFERDLLSIDALMTETDRTFEPSTGRSPEHIFVDRWREAVVQTVLARLKELLEREDRGLWFQLFESNLLSGPDQTLGQAELARQHSLSRDQVRYAISQVRQRFVQVLRSELRLDGATGEECEAEVSELLQTIESL